MDTALLVEQSSPAEWFATWFDSDYYQQLYAHRDEREAANFVDRLVRRLEIGRGASILDLGCGNGRHTIHLAARGFRVTGCDLSAASLALARTRADQSVRWMKQDMRRPFGTGAYDYIFNLFTSFGYFEQPSDHLSVVANMARALRPGGRAVIDFLNVPRTAARLRRHEVVRCDGVVYRITRWSDESAIFKRILVEDRINDRSCSFVERVANLTRRDFEGLFARCGLELEDVYGDYTLAPFDVRASERLILVARKVGAADVRSGPATSLCECG